jgi:serine/threonine protein phosphatase 1
VSDGVSLPSLAQKPFSAKVADGMRVYAIGDIHGRGDLLRPLLARIGEDTSAHPTIRPIYVFLGDYVDRGPSSRDVINQLILLSKHQEAAFLKGNHEHYLMEFLKNPPFLVEWLQYGGLDTLRSYGVVPKNYLDSREQDSLATSLGRVLRESGHHEFLTDLRTSFVCGEFFFAHAGVRPGVPLDQQSQKDLLEIRNDFLSSNSGFGRIVVHGHTPVPRPDIRSNRINIDTGAYATGLLSCLVLERDEIRFV